jgi:phosphoribosylaminoimidazolecarboxamide formyltransferase/IMP cyclohydrolase
MPRALMSVSDKDGIIPFAKALSLAGWEIVASGGTANSLRDNDIKVIDVADVTGHAEMLGGRVKTLHPAIHAGILAREHSQDRNELEQAGYREFDLVVCNLYPFQKTVAKPNVKLDEAIEKIDIGGVTLIRAAAKNFQRVTVVVDPADYGSIEKSLTSGDGVPLDKRRSLAVKAFGHTRDYDTAIHSFLENGHTLSSSGELEETYSLALTQVQELRYGENSHQLAALYARQSHTGPLTGQLLQGKPLSYNNLLDADAAWRAVSSFDPDDQAAVVIVKHLNPTGIAVSDTLAESFAGALASDPVSAFGGVIAVNRKVDLNLVDALGSLFVEVLVAPEFDAGAQERLASGRKNCRLIQVPNFANTPDVEMRSILGGVLLQSRDIGDPETADWKVVTERQPTADELRALQFAWTAVQHVKSNAIVLAGPSATYGIGGGLPSRVDAATLAVSKAGNRAQGAVMASDAFFPFADGIEVGVRAGVTAIIQPGGSIRDQEVIDAANAAGVAMVMTGVRHFRH